MVYVLSMKVAVTEVLEFIVTVQTVDVPEHPPDHPAKVEPASAVAVKVTTVPALKTCPRGTGRYRSSPRACFGHGEGVGKWGKGCLNCMAGSNVCEIVRTG